MAPEDIAERKTGIPRGKWQAKLPVGGSGVEVVEKTIGSPKPQWFRDFSGRLVTRATLAGIGQGTMYIDTDVSNNTTGRMFLMDSVELNAKQGVATQFTIKNGGQTPLHKVALVVFRGGTKVYQSIDYDVTPTIQLEQSFRLEKPFELLAGDKIGVWLPAASLPDRISVHAHASSTLKYLDTTNPAAVTLESQLTQTLANFAVNVAVEGRLPSLAVSGDSIAAGGNMNNVFAGWRADPTRDPGGNPLACPGWVLSRRLNFGFENHALGSQTFAWVRSTGIPGALVAEPTHLWVHCGVNDINTSRTWAQVEADLNAIRDLIPIDTKLFFSEILPWTNGSDSQALTVRTWNRFLADWCEQNDAILVRCHDALGQTRGSTGELDDLKTEFDQDGVHLTEAGVVALVDEAAKYIP